MVYKFAFILVSLMYSSHLISQSKDSVMAINRKYKKEISIDLQGLLKPDPGTALILRIKNNRSRFVALTSAKNFRFQLGINGTLPTKEKTTSPDSTTSLLSQEARSFNIQAMFGMEKVKFYGKFNFYYGFDVGPSYTYRDNGYSTYTYTLNNGSTIYALTSGLQTETKKAGLSVVPFIGAKYRISEHFSASIESGFYLSYFMSYINTYRISYMAANTIITNEHTLIAEKTYSGFDFSMKYLRFLTLNYHL